MTTPTDGQVERLIDAVKFLSHGGISNIEIKMLVDGIGDALAESLRELGHALAPDERIARGIAESLQAIECRLSSMEKMMENYLEPISPAGTDETDTTCSGLETGKELQRGRS